MHRFQIAADFFVQCADEQSTTTITIIIIIIVVIDRRRNRRWWNIHKTKDLLLLLLLFVGGLQSSAVACLLACSWGDTAYCMYTSRLAIATRWEREGGQSKEELFCWSEESTHEKDVWTECMIV